MANVCQLKDVLAAFIRGEEYWETAITSTSTEKISGSSAERDIAGDKS